MGVRHMTLAPATPAVTGRLSAMMFLQFFLWGAWYVTLGPFMNSQGMPAASIGNAYSVGPIAAILAPVFLGLVADRFLPTQIVLGIMHVLGGLLLLAAPSLVPEAGGSPWPFVGVLFAHMLCYMPTLGLSNTVAFHAITNPEKQFPMIRVLGTIGWIAAGLLIGFLASSKFPYANFLPAGFSLAEFETAKAAMDAKQTVEADVLAKVKAVLDATASARNSWPMFFYLAGGSAVLLGLYSLTLPSTPPPAKGKPFSLTDALGFESIKLLRDPPFAVFVVCSFLICIPLAAYYSFGGVYAGAVGLADVPIKMSFGQMSEIAFMLVMPLCFARLGVKWMLAVGMLAWVVRYGLFGAAWGGSPESSVQWMVLGGIILHGICYDFFFVTGQIYVDRKAPVTIRGQAQGFLVLITQGLGMLVGSQLFPKLVNHFTTGPKDAQVIDWKMVWLVPAGFAALIMLVFIALFKDKQAAEAKAQV